MKSCILTVIKNEHEYLDEWIQYHLNLGIDYIFIFEDIDSDSHKEITDKYDKVFLKNITFLFNEKEIKKIKESKTSKTQGNIQHMYYKTGISYIKKQYNFDWCFVIDNDEFITLEKGKNLTNVLSLYNNYDAVILQWKCYGANGYVNKPDYNKGTIETFTKEITGKLPDRSKSLVKTCYNLNKFKEGNLLSQHLPSLDSNWCKTDFTKNIEIPIYNNIFIRHYVTRSWEEWIWKIKTRGSFWGETRHLDTFFEINSDMEYLKQDLINDYKNNITSCIFTIIKNEQEYLKEWIDYHLNLGINYIFILEDFDSTSHKEITDKYSNVKLIRAKDFLNEKQFQEAIRLKQSSAPQNFYLNLAINHIKKCHSYIDWVFIIDNDEFLTLEEGKTLQDIFVEFQSYDAFVMHWKCYGANNLVFKPDYSKKGVVETYTKPAKGRLLNEARLKVKTCYNMNKYKDGYLFNMHTPSNICLNKCNTNHETNFLNETYKNIYIRHYITRSLEEYLWKKESRGQQERHDDNLSMFYWINPEMKDKKEEHLKLLRPETLVILPYVQSLSQGNEIRLCLNAWKKFCTFKYKFIVVGEFLDDLKNEFPWVKFIYIPKINNIEGEYTPHLDIFNKMFMLMNKYYSHQNFIYITDDEYAIKPFTLEDITTTHYLTKETKGNPNSPSNYWTNNLWKTKKYLLEHDHPTINYVTHYPVYFNIDKLLELERKIKLRKNSYVLENLYFNIFPTENIKQVDSIRLGIWNNDIFKNKFKDAINNPNIKFVCNSVQGWSKELEVELNNLINDGKTN